MTATVEHKRTKWERDRPLTLSEISQKDPLGLRQRVDKVTECKVIGERDYYGEGYQEKWEYDTVKMRHVNVSVYGTGCYYNLYGKEYEPEEGERKTGKGVLLTFGGSPGRTYLEVALMKKRVYTLYGEWHTTSSGGMIGKEEFEINVEDSATVIQRMANIPDFGDLLAINQKAKKYASLTGRTLPKREELSAEEKRKAEFLWKTKGWMVEGEKNREERIEKCRLLIPTLDDVIHYYLKPLPII